MAIVVAMAAAGLGLTACASTTTPGPGTSPSSPATSPSSPAQSAPATSVRTSAGSSTGLSTGLSTTALPSVPSAGTGTEVTLRGTVREGVEAHCLLLADDSGTVLANLLGDDSPQLTVGARVEVTGSFEEGLMTTCQQGPPFAVTSVRAL